MSSRLNSNGLDCKYLSKQELNSKDIDSTNISCDDLNTKTYILAEIPNPNTNIYVMKMPNQ